ncbi:single-stranded DNA-binding protein [Actinosynnema sp. NPDC059335]|uniref:single-stranded DNA-binding protein n=1 Tax=Actinosynnema sp. NPDC059335 TaxID=3346804 RepID=UPI00366E6DE6
MAYNESRVTVCGNVASAVTRSTVGTGFSRAKFRLFTAERVWDAEQRTWEDGARMFLSVSCWRMLADNAHASLNKGDPVVVTGRLTIKEVEYEGAVRPLVEIEATAIGHNLALCTAVPTRTRHTPDAVEARAAPEIAAPRKADDLPLIVMGEVDRPAADPVPAARSNADRAAAARSNADRVPAARSKVDHAAAARPNADRAVAARSKVDRAAADRPNADRVPAARSKVDRAAADRPREVAEVPF